MKKAKKILTRFLFFTEAFFSGNFYLAVEKKQKDGTKKVERLMSGMSVKSGRQIVNDIAEMITDTIEEENAVNAAQQIIDNKF